MNKHIITVEGLAKSSSELHPIQEILYNNYSTQCGFCTPGIIMSIFAYLADNQDYSEAELKESLNGNLCRCTGYVHIVQGAQAVLKYYSEAGRELIPERISEGNRKLQELATEFNLIASEQDKTSRGVEGYYLIKSLAKYQEVVKKLKATGTIKVVAGATDLFVVGNLTRTYFKNYLDITYIPELRKITYVNNQLRIGAAVSLETIRNNALIKENLPILSQVVSQMASKQIRNIASIGGNVGNASPVGDCATSLIGLNARLLLFGEDGEREVSIDQFYKGYKKTVLLNHEFIKEIIIPIQGKGFYSFEKSSKRKTLDISSVCSFCYIEHSDGLMNISRLAFGGVAAYPKLTLSNALELRGKNIKDIDIEKIAEGVAKEFTPISDIRGSAEYRHILIRNHTIKHLEKLKEEVKSES
jgi:xanthine dehydrogenase small subunit